MTRHFPIAKPGDDDCPTCGAPDVAWPTCKECKAMDIGYLHELVRLAPVHRGADPETGRDRVAA